MKNKDRSRELAERWDDIFQKFLEGRFPEDVQRDWNSSFGGMWSKVKEDGIQYAVLLNPGRAKRLAIKQRTDIKIPKIGESIQEYKNGKEHTNLFGEDYFPYYALINIFPIDKGHVNLCYKEGNPNGSKNGKIERGELEAAMRFSMETGHFMWRNTENAGMTIDNWKHIQGIGLEPSIRYAKKEVIDRHNRIYYMPDFPGANILFEGKENLGKVLSVTERLFNERVGHPVVIDREDVYVFAVKDEYAGHNEFGLEKDSRIGGFELAAGTYIALNEGDFNRFVKGELKVKQLLEKALYSQKEKKLGNFIR